MAFLLDQGWIVVRLAHRLGRVCTEDVTPGSATRGDSANPAAEAPRRVGRARRQRAPPSQPPRTRLRRWAARARRHGVLPSPPPADPAVVPVALAPTKTLRLVGGWS